MQTILFLMLLKRLWFYLCLFNESSQLSLGRRALSVSINFIPMCGAEEFSFPALPKAKLYSGSALPS